MRLKRYISARFIVMPQGTFSYAFGIIHLASLGIYTILHAPLP